MVRMDLKGAALVSTIGHDAWGNWFVLDSADERSLDYLHPTNLEIVSYTIDRSGQPDRCDAAFVLLRFVSIQRNVEIPEVVSDDSSLRRMCSSGGLLRGRSKLDAIENLSYYTAVPQLSCRAVLCGVALSDISDRSRGKSDASAKIESHSLRSLRRRVYGEEFGSQSDASSWSRLRLFTQSFATSRPGTAALHPSSHICCFRMLRSLSTCSAFGWRLGLST